MITESDARGEAAGPARRNLEESSKHSAVRPATESAPLWSGADEDLLRHFRAASAHWDFITLLLVFCLFVWGKPRKSILRSLSPIFFIKIYIFCYSTYGGAQDMWLTLYKLTGWFASLDLRKPNTRRILNHQNNHPLRLNIMLQGKEPKEP